MKPRSLSTSFNLQSCWLLALCLRRWLFKTTSGVDKIAGKPPDFEINIILTFLWIEWGWQTCGLHCRVKTEFNQVFTSAARKFVNFALVGKLACLLSMYFLDKTTTKYNLLIYIYADFQSRWLFKTTSVVDKIAGKTTCFWNQLNADNFTDWMKLTNLRATL